MTSGVSPGGGVSRLIRRIRRHAVARRSAMASPRPVLSLRSRIVVLTCAVTVLTAALLGAFAYHRSGEIALQTSRIALRGETRLLAQRLDATMADVGGDLKVISGAPLIEALFRALQNSGTDPQDNSRSERIEDRLRKLFGAVMLSNPAYRSIDLTGVWGGRIVGISRRHSGLTVDPKTDVWTDRMPDWAAAASSLLRPGQVLKQTDRDGRTSVTRFVTPVRHSGSVVALLSIGVDAEELVAPLLAGVSGPTGVFLLDGQVPARPVAGPVDDLDRLVAAADRAGADRWSRDGGYDAFATADSASAVFVAATDPPDWMRGSLFGVALVVSQDTLLAPAVAARSHTLAIVGVLLTAAALISVVTAHVITLPLKNLTRIVLSTKDASGLGDLPVDRPDEVGDLSRAVDGLAQRLARTESHAREVLESVDDAVATFNPAGILLTVNPAARRMFPAAQPGALASAVLPIPKDTLTGADRDSLCTFSMRSDAGVDRHFEAVLSRQQSGPTGFATAVIRDVTAAKEVELIKEQLLGTISHELRTPLTAIKASLILLRHQMIESGWTSNGNMVDLALSNTHRLVRLVDDILSMEKTRSGQLEYTFRDIDLTPFLQSFLNGQNALAEAHGVSFSFGPADRDFTIEADPDRLEQIVLNLVSNAAKFSPAGTSVRVSLACRGADRVCISVNDCGPGIAPEYRDRIFQPFVCDDSKASTIQAGTGLGLNIARTMTHAMNGRISFDCDPKGGTTFRLVFPLKT